MKRFSRDFSSANDMGTGAAAFFKRTKSAIMQFHGAQPATPSPP
jgi:hypothetical protein